MLKNSFCVFKNWLFFYVEKFIGIFINVGVNYNVYIVNVIEFVLFNCIFFNNSFVSLVLLVSIIIVTPLKNRHLESMEFVRYSGVSAIGGKTRKYPQNH